jgi:hypothetical protein
MPRCTHVATLSTAATEKNSDRIVKSSQTACYKQNIAGTIWKKFPGRKRYDDSNL